MDAKKCERKCKNKKYEFCLTFRFDLLCFFHSFFFIGDNLMSVRNAIHTFLLQLQLFYFYSLYCLRSEKCHDAPIPQISVSPTLFGSQHPYLALKIFDGTLSWFNRYKDQGIVTCVSRHHGWKSLP